MTRAQRFLLGACRVYQTAAVVVLVSADLWLCAAAAWYELVRVVTEGRQR